jgi:hypothetical protein
MTAPDEARAKRSPRARRAARLACGDHFAGIEGHEILASAAAVVFVGLLAAEGYTTVNIGGLVSTHVFIGMVLIPPLLPLRLIASMLVASTVAVLVTGVVLLAAGRKSDAVVQLHELSFIVFGVVFAAHFIAFMAQLARSLRHGGY